jgi:nitrate reductase beta subunit
MEAQVHASFEKAFMMYLPRICEHCLNPSCVAACPSGSIYKREEDGIVLIDQNKCRGWRMCVSGCPYKKIYFNWKTGKSEKCTLCYPRLEVGEPTVCSETCVGRLRYLGVILYDADKIAQAASVENETDLYEAQLDAFLDPFDPAVAEAAERDGVHGQWLDAARRSPVYKLCARWRVAFPLHPEYRTLPMVWYVPPLSPLQDAAAQGYVGWNGAIPDVRRMQIPLRYLANLLTAGAEEPVAAAHERMFAMRCASSGATATSRASRTSACSPRSASARPTSRRCTATWRSPSTRTASWCRRATARSRRRSPRSRARSAAAASRRGPR